MLGVVAPKEYDAIQAAAQLKVQWSDPPAISGSGNLWKWMRDQDSRRQGAGPHRGAERENVDAAMKSAAKTYSGTFTYHYQMHAPIGPNIAIADVTKDSAIIYTHVKNGYGNTAAADRGGAEHASGRLRPTRVRVIYYEGASSFGGGAQHVDVGEAAAILSTARACPSGSSSCAGTSTAGTTTARPRCGTSAGGVDANGKIVAFDATSFGMGSYNKTPTESQVGQPMRRRRATARPTRPTRARSTTSRTGGSIGKTTPTLNNSFKTSTLRAPNAHADVLRRRSR